jgi:hypothetical protein
VSYWGIRSRRSSKEGSRMDEGGESGNRGRDTRAGGEDAGRQGIAGDGPGSETERFRAVTELDLRHNEAVTGESGVPRSQRDHELRRQMNSLDEFS